MINTLFKNAIDSIPEQYYKIINPIIRNGNKIDYSKVFTHPERRYVMELFYQIKINLTSSGTTLPNNTYLDGEIFKKLHTSLQNDTYKKTFNTYINKTNGIYPDLIIHQGQNITDNENQIMVVECKTISNLSAENFNKDFFKLFIYTKEFSFQNSFFLIVNNTKQHIQHLLENYKKEYYYEKLNQIKIFVKESYNSNTIIINLEDI